MSKATSAGMPANTSASVGKWSSSSHCQVRSVGSLGCAGASLLCLRSRRPLELLLVMPLRALMALPMLARLMVEPQGLEPRGVSSPARLAESSAAEVELMGASWRNSAEVMSLMRRLVGAASSPYTTKLSCQITGTPAGREVAGVGGWGGSWEGQLVARQQHARRL